MSEDKKTRAGRCPICGAPTETGYRPFCSARCRDVDLGRWLGGGYAIAGGNVEADEDGDDARGEPGGNDPRRDDGDDPA